MPTIISPSNSNTHFNKQLNRDGQRETAPLCYEPVNLPAQTVCRLPVGGHNFYMIPLVCAPGVLGRDLE